jgi:hypothetical protein
MRTNVPEKLLKIVANIEQTGSAPLTRLTVLKKWLEYPGRLPAFALWVARRAALRKGKSMGETAELFAAAKSWLASVAICRVPPYDQQEAETLHSRLRNFQNDHIRGAWGPVRQIKNMNLLLIEQCLAITLQPQPLPVEGYRLAANYCEHYDPRYGNCLNGPSITKIQELVRFMFDIEAQEQDQTMP